MNNNDWYHEIESILIGGALTISAILLTLSLQSLFRGNRVRPIDPRRDRGEVHVKRRAQHVATGLLFFGISFTPLANDCYIRYTGVLLLTMALVVYGVHRARLTNSDLDAFLKRNLSDLIRKHEYDGQPPGALYFLIGVAFVCLASERSPVGKHTGRLALLCLSLGDPAAGFFGTLFNANKEPSSSRFCGNKSWQGSLACFFICFISALVYLAISFAVALPQDVLQYRFDANLVINILRASFITGVLGAVYEALPIPLDDNLVIPVGVLLSLDLSRRVGLLQLTA